MSEERLQLMEEFRLDMTGIEATTAAHDDNPHPSFKRDPLVFKFEHSNFLFKAWNSGRRSTLSQLAALREELADTIQSAWEAAGGNPGIKASHDELLSALRLMDEADDEHESTRQRLADAELRNAEIIQLLSEVIPYEAYLGSKLFQRINAALNKPEEAKSIDGLTCNQVREESGLPTNNPCKACNNGACIDR